MATYLKRKIEGASMSRNKKTFFFSRERKIYTGFLISYLIILLVTIVISSIAYIISAKTIENDIQNYNLALIKQTKETVEKRLKELWQLSYQISQSEDFIRILFAGNRLNLEYRLDNILRIFKDLNIFKSLNNFFDHYYIYLKNSNSIIDFNSIYDPDFYYKEIASYDNMSYDEWYNNILNSNQHRMFIPSSPVKLQISAKKYNMITYALTIPESVANAKIVFLIGENQILSLFNNLKISGLEQFYIIDSHNNIITQTGSQTGFIKKLPYVPTKEGISYDTLNGKRIVVASTKSEMIDWTYNIIIPREIFLQKVNYIKNFYLTIEIVAIVIGILIAVLFSYRNYIPIRKIIEFIRNKKGDDGFKSTATGYDYIKYSILSSFDEANSLKSMLENYKGLLRTNYIIKLIKGEAPEQENKREISDSLGVNLDFKSFAVIVLQVENINISSLESGLDFNNIVSNKLSSISEKPDSFYFIELETGKYIAAFCFATENEKEIVNRINFITDAIKQYCLSVFGLNIKIAVGKIVYSVKEIPYSFSYAEKELKNGSSMSIQIYYYPVNIETQLSNKAVSGNIDDVLILLEEIYVMNFTTLDLSYQMAQYLFFAIMNTVVNVIYEIDMNIGYNPLQALSAFTNVDKMYDFTRDVFKDICKWVNEKKVNRHIKANKEIINFIDNNYNNMNLSLSMISEKYNMAMSSIYKIIKEQTSEGFVDYLNMCRLNKAKQLLEDTRLLISEIAKNVGYQSDNSFIRIFKKYFGITPGQYREARMKKLK